MDETKKKLEQSGGAQNQLEPQEKDSLIQKASVFKPLQGILQTKPGSVVAIGNAPLTGSVMGQIGTPINTPLVLKTNQILQKTNQDKFSF